jgi:RimJ/RimL family protein N-acetyltransferase
MARIETARLILRPWAHADVAEIWRVTNTAAVMEYMGGVAAPDAFAAMVERIMRSQRECGFSFWIVQRREDGALLGFCGFKRGTVGPIIGEMEIGWRLREDAWGRGYAREAAGACLDWAWANLDCEKIFAITVMGNVPSWGLMQRLGMTRRADLDFDHPNFPPDHPLAPHITYEIECPVDARRDGIGRLM